MPSCGRFLARLPVLCSALLACGLGLTLESRALAFTPDWQKGQTWTVSTVYRGLALGRPEPGEKRKTEWTPATNWVFYVARVEDRKDGRYFLVQVKDRENTSSALASLVFASYKLKGGESALALVRGKFLRMIRGERIVTEQTINEVGQTPRPVLHEQSLIPYDFPSTPLLEPGASPRKRTFEITEDTGPMKFAKDIGQSEETGVDPHTWAGDDLEKRSGFKKAPREKIMFVALTREMDGSASHQIWVPGLPWPVYSDNSDSRSVLIYHSGEGKSGASTGPTTATTK